jgi:hypothetical protein
MLITPIVNSQLLIKYIYSDDQKSGEYSRIYKICRDDPHKQDPSLNLNNHHSLHSSLLLDERHHQRLKLHHRQHQTKIMDFLRNRQVPSEASASGIPLNNVVQP